MSERKLLLSVPSPTFLTYDAAKFKMMLQSGHTIRPRYGLSWSVRLTAY